MKIDILTIFPQFFAPLEYSIVRRARDKGLVDLSVRDLREWSDDNYKSVDDRPYGGGAGMIMRLDVIDRALEDLRGTTNLDPYVLVMDPKGEKFTQRKAVELATKRYVLLIAGHYEGIDHRVNEHLADESISVGDYVLSGGEIPAMTIVEATVRLLPGALGNEESLLHESHDPETSILEYPQYTRPAEYRGWKVPEVLLSGNHKEITKWRSLQTRKATDHSKRKP